MKWLMMESNGEFYGGLVSTWGPLVEYMIHAYIHTSLLHPMDPQVCQMTIGCGTSHNNKYILYKYNSYYYTDFT
jgi:hypothetical protein